MSPSSGLEHVLGAVLAVGDRGDSRACDDARRSRARPRWPPRYTASAVASPRTPDAQLAAPTGRELRAQVGRALLRVAHLVDQFG